MKWKLLIAFVCLAFYAQTGYAQDIITKQNGDAVKSKILEVSTEYVKYKRFDYLTGPDYTLAALEVFMIKYENGSKDVFEKNPTTGKIQIRHIAAAIQPPTTTISTPTSTTTTTPTPTPTPIRETVGQAEPDIVDLLENNIIEAEITGGDITYVNLQVRRLVSDAVDVRIPAGCFFVAEKTASQNMVATAETKMRLATNSWTDIAIPAVSANRSKKIAGSNDRFSVQRSPKQEELARLMSVLGKSNASVSVKQAAVWIVTDDANFDELGSLTNAEKKRAIWYETTARAMKACNEANIDLSQKRIWNDRGTIISKLADGELKSWLKSFGDVPAGLSVQETKNPKQSVSSGKSNGIFEIISVDKDSVTFKTHVETELYVVTLTTNTQTFEVNSFSSLKGDFYWANGSVFWEGSDVPAPKTVNITAFKLLDNSVITAYFKTPTGFIPKKALFITSENAEPMSYDISKAKWELKH